MKVTIQYLLGALAVVIAIALLVSTIASYSYKMPVRLSEGSFKDSGFWSCPRYHVTFDTFETGQDVGKLIAVSGLPSCVMFLGLHVVEDISDVQPTRMHELLKSKFDLEQIVIQVRIADSNGNEVFAQRIHMTFWTFVFENSAIRAADTEWCVSLEADDGWMSETAWS
jgi:hypothetical protein